MMKRILLNHIVKVHKTYNFITKIQLNFYMRRRLFITHSNFNYYKKG